MKNFIRLSIFIISTCLIISCNKEDKSINQETGSLKFTFGSPSDGLKSAKDDEGLHIVISIEDNTSKSVIEMKKIPLYNFNGDYISKPVTLKPGSYNLTLFMVINKNGDVIYMSPDVGSNLGSKVSNPLPVSFAIKSNQVTKVVPQVISTQGYTAEDFGFSSFSFEIIEITDMKIAAFIYNEKTKNFKLTSAEMVVAYPSYEENYVLNSMINDISLDNFNYIIMSFYKYGYNTIDTFFTKDQLDSSLINPIKIIFTEQNFDSIFSIPIPPPVAYYPCNGDGNEIIGGFNGEILNIEAAIDRFGRPDKALYWDGDGLEYLKVPISDFNFADIFQNEGALTFWFKAIPDTGVMATIFSSCQNVNTSHLGPRLWAKMHKNDSLYLSFYHKHPDALNRAVAYLQPSEGWHHVILNWDTTSIEFIITGLQHDVSYNRDFKGNVYMSDYMSFGSFILDNVITKSGFRGYIDDILFFDRKLIGDQIYNVVEFGTPVY